MRISRRGLTAWAIGLLLVVLHVDAWRPKRDVLWFDAIPEELGYRVAWMLAAAVYLVWFTACVWRSEGDEAS